MDKSEIINVIDSIKNWSESCPFKKELINKIKSVTNPSDESKEED